MMHRHYLFHCPLYLSLSCPDDGDPMQILRLRLSLYLSLT